MNHLVPFWFIVIAILWTGFLILEGFDFGVGMLHTAVGTDDASRRAAINSIGPLWDGNEVWLIVAAAAIFAAFPGWYATMFSGLYLAMVLLLAALVARLVAPVTAAFVLGFVIWTHVTASTTFFLHPVELLAVLAAIAAVWLVYDHRDGFAFAATTVTMAASIVSIFTGLYPNVMVSSTSKAYNLTVHNTASGP